MLKISIFWTVFNVIFPQYAEHRDILFVYEPNNSTNIKTIATTLLVPFLERKFERVRALPY